MRMNFFITVTISQFSRLIAKALQQLLNPIWICITKYAGVIVKLLRFSCQMGDRTVCQWSLCI